jgi:hypothetical protein
MARCIVLVMLVVIEKSIIYVLHDCHGSEVIKNLERESDEKNCRSLL